MSKNAKSDLSIRGFAHTRKGATSPTAYVELFSTAANGAEAVVNFRGSYVQASYVEWILDNGPTVRAAIAAARKDVPAVVVAPAAQIAPAAPVVDNPLAAFAGLDPVALQAILAALAAAQGAPVVAPAAAPVAAAAVSRAAIAPAAQSLADRVKARAKR